MDKLGEAGKRVNSTKKYWDTVQHLLQHFCLILGPPATAAVPLKMPVPELREKRVKQMVIFKTYNIVYLIYHLLVNRW